MNNNMLCKVLLNLIVWEDCGLIVVDSIYSKVGIGFPDAWNSSAAGVIVGMIFYGFDAMVSMKAKYLSRELEVKACQPFAEK